MGSNTLTPAERKKRAQGRAMGKAMAAKAKPQPIEDKLAQMMRDEFEKSPLW